MDFSKTTFCFAKKKLFLYIPKHVLRLHVIFIQTKQNVFLSFLIETQDTGGMVKEKNERKAGRGEISMRPIRAKFCVNVATLLIRIWAIWVNNLFKHLYETNF